jgi:hypothetical protein
MMKTGRDPKHILIGGGSGFIGSALADKFNQLGWIVTIISRSAGSGRITWEDLERDGLPPCDIAINLAGRHIMDLRRRWTPAYRDEVLSSRVNTTRILVKAINASANPPALFISTSGKCFYGSYSDDDRRVCNEQSNCGTDFPGQLSGMWECAAREVDQERVRHVHIRVGVVLGAIRGRSFPIGFKRGILPVIRLPFCLGLGGKLGSGKQFLPWVHIDDVVGLFLHAIEREDMQGIYNAVSPDIVTNAEFTSLFARHLRRPAWFTKPAWMVKWIIGAERAPILLEGQYVVPERTLAAGYRFLFPSLDNALTDLVRIHC